MIVCKDCKFAEHGTIIDMYGKKHDVTFCIANAKGKNIGSRKSCKKFKKFSKSYEK